MALPLLSGEVFFDQNKKDTDVCFNSSALVTGFISLKFYISTVHWLCCYLCIALVNLKQWLKV